MLSDIKMPPMDGIALARHILSTLPITPIFLITADVSDCFEDILKFGVPYVTKPLLLNHLLAQIHKMLGDMKAEL